MLTPEEKAKAVARLAKNPSILFEILAESTNASEAELIECLPPEMWSKADADHFESILTTITEWGKLTTIIHTEDVIAEFSGNFPTGSISHGFYNLNNESGLHGHLRYKNCGAIYFVTRPFKGTETRSILFSNQKGGIMFKVFLGRDESHKIFDHQIEKFTAMADQYKSDAP